MHSIYSNKLQVNVKIYDEFCKFSKEIHTFTTGRVVMYWIRLQYFWSESWLVEKTTRFLKFRLRFSPGLMGHAVAKKPWERGWDGGQVIVPVVTLKATANRICHRLCNCKGHYFQLCINSFITFDGQILPGTKTPRLSNFQQTFYSLPW